MFIVNTFSTLRENVVSSVYSFKLFVSFRQNFAARGTFQETFLWNKKLIPIYFTT